MNKFKTIPFDINIAKSIQKGEKIGNIITCKGNPVKIVCWNVLGKFPIAALIKDENNVEHSALCDSDGTIYESEYLHDYLVLQVMDDSLQYKVGDVLALESGAIFIFDQFDNDKNKFFAFFSKGELIFPDNNVYYCGYKSNIRGYATAKELAEFIKALIKKNDKFSNLLLRVFFSIE